jgi:hypothetical protein
MTIRIASGITDDNDFIPLVQSVLSGLLAQGRPEQVWIIHIDNWFDHKWLRFSGNGIVKFWPGVGPIASDFIINRVDSSKSPLYQERLTFPPFAPDRVLGQWSYSHGNGEYREFPSPALPHSTERKRSKSNLQRRVQQFSGSACFLWYSGNTLANGRGAVMVYSVDAPGVSCWYAAFSRKDGWRLDRTKGIQQDEVQKLIDVR